MTRPAGSTFPAAGTTSPIRVLVVDDSATQRGLLISLLTADPGLEVAGWAANGAEAVKQTARLRPDVITMDLHMPVMDGLEATRQILQETPTPIVMVTSSPRTGDRQRALELFKAGVLAVVVKPTGSPDDDRGSELLRTVKSMAQVKVIRRWSPERLRLRQSGAPATTAGRPSAIVRSPSTPASQPGPTQPLKVVAIGASTGGPQALQEILTRLPATFALPVLVVQHIAPGFEAGLVDWLRPQCPLPIQLAARQTLAAPGIYVAPTGSHLTVRGRMVALTGDPAVSGHRPSATVLFRSVAKEYGAAAVGVLLTGMGDDGATGLRDLKRVGAITVAQDEESSVVFSMPATAIKMGVVDHVLPPASIAPLLVDLAGRRVMRTE